MELRAGLAGLADQGTKLYMPFYLALLAEIEAEMGAIGLSRIDEALALAGQTGERWSDAFCIGSAAKSCSSATPPTPACAQKRS